jgi:hypothetical protein
LAEQFRDSLDNFIVQANQTANQIANNLQNFLTQSGDEIQNFIDDVQTEIATLIGDKVLPCLIDTGKKLEKIRNDTHDSIEKCVNESRIRSEDINKEIAVYVNNTSDQVELMRASVVACIEETDLGDKIKCAVDASGVFYSSTGNILENIANATRTGISSMYFNANQTHHCISLAKEDCRNRTLVVFNDTTDCLDNTE